MSFSHQLTEVALDRHRLGGLTDIVPKLGGIDAVLAEQIVERRPRAPEQLRRTGQIAFGHSKGLPNRLRFGALARDPEAEVLRILQAQVARGDHGAFPP